MTNQTNETDVVKGVRGWLEKQGYPLEMRTASRFDARGFGVEQSFYYVRGTDPPREIDMYASMQLDDPRVRWRPAHGREREYVVSDSGEPLYLVDLFVLAECKSGPQER